MNASTLDIHRTVKRLVEAGFSPEQAETVTDVLVETRAFDLSELATKADISALKGDIRAVQADLRAAEMGLKADMRALESSLSAKIADSQRTTLQWTFGLIVAMVAVMAGLIKLLAAH